MKNLCLLIAIAGILMVSCENETEQKIVMKYPVTKKADTVNVYFGTSVPDPYQWLENDTSPEVAEWVKAQNAVTFGYLDSIPFRDKIKERLTTIWNFERQSAPFKKGKRYFMYRNNGLQNQSVLYYADAPDAEFKVLLDANTLSSDGTVSLANVDISSDGKTIAYSISRAGSDWQEIYFRDIESGKDLPDHLEWVKFSGLSWSGKGVFYSGYASPKKGTELSAKNEFHKLWYHELGTSQDKDKLIMENTTDPLRMFYAGVTEDEQFLLIWEEMSGKLGSRLIVKDLSQKNGEFVNITNDFDYEYGVIENIENILYVRTNKNAPKYRLVKISLDNPAEENWTEIIPECDDVPGFFTVSGGKIVANYMKDAHSVLKVFDLEGKFIREIDLPGIGTVQTFNGLMKEEEAFYEFTSYNYPTTTIRINMNTFDSKIYFQPKVDFDPAQYEVNQVFYTSKDGTKIPMFLVHKKGIELNGNNPALLYGYGGFNHSITPSFSIGRIIWLENGGVLAMACLRGGGEYGKEWHLAGTKLQKQNVFDDFIAAAEYLISEKYTSSNLLAIQGGSNGGLLVGAVTNQRPELFRVALPAVGVMDMLRFHKFTIGWGWVTDYGSSDNKEEFEYLYKYSPLHNIKSDLEYPAVLVTTADHDDRVVPAHSFKYIATLQEKYKGTNPVLIRIETQAGHGGGKPTAKVIEEAADIYAFTFFNMGIDVKY